MRLAIREVRSSVEEMSYVAENVMRFYPDLDLGVVVMANIPGYHPGWIAEDLVSAWMNER